MTYIIAEAGTNFVAPTLQIRVMRAKNLAMDAAACGADAVKFQWFVPDEPLFCPVEGDEKRWSRWLDTIMPLSSWAEIAAFCREQGIDFLASVFQHGALDLLKTLEPRYYKVASRAAATFPYKSCPGPFLVSSPGPGWTSHYQLQCTPKYPTPLNEARWRGDSDGLSDHSGNVFVGQDAIARGAKFLEVHFTRGNFDAGNDAPVCLEPDDLRYLCYFRETLEEMAAA